MYSLTDRTLHTLVGFSLCFRISWNTAILFIIIFAGFRLDLNHLFAYMNYMCMTLHDILIQSVFTFLPISQLQARAMFMRGESLVGEYEVQANAVGDND